MSKILYYHFTPEEVLALYKFFKNEYINPKREELKGVVNHISKIIESNEFPLRNH